MNYKLFVFTSNYLKKKFKLRESSKAQAARTKKKVAVPQPPSPGNIPTTWLSNRHTFTITNFDTAIATETAPVGLFLVLLNP
jgi:hypothetical protein